MVKTSLNTAQLSGQVDAWPQVVTGSEARRSAGNDGGSPYRQSNFMELRHRGSNFLLEGSLP